MYLPKQKYQNNSSIFFEIPEYENNIENESFLLVMIRIHRSCMLTTLLNQYLTKLYLNKTPSLQAREQINGYSSDTSDRKTPEFTPKIGPIFLSNLPEFFKEYYPISPENCPKFSKYCSRRLMNKFPESYPYISQKKQLEVSEEFLILFRNAQPFWEIARFPKIPLISIRYVICDEIIYSLPEVDW